MDRSTNILPTFGWGRLWLNEVLPSHGVFSTLEAHEPSQGVHIILPKLGIQPMSGTNPYRILYTHTWCWEQNVPSYSLMISFYNLAGGFNPRRKNWEMLGSSHQIALKTETNHRHPSTKNSWSDTLRPTYRISGQGPPGCDPRAPHQRALPCTASSASGRGASHAGSRRPSRESAIFKLHPWARPDEQWIVVGSTGRIPSSWFGSLGNQSPADTHLAIWRLRRFREDS